jgi:hypothetical protein
LALRTKYILLEGAGLPHIREEFDRMLDEYNLLHGWDKEGIPEGRTLERLGLR